MSEEPVTVVIFRKWKDNGQVIALFPEIPATYDGDSCESYMKVGEHSGASYYHVVQRTVPATEQEYASLKRLLESEPFNYRFRVLRKAAWKHHQKRRDGARELRKRLRGTQQ